MGLLTTLTRFACFAVDLGSICTKYTTQLPLPTISVPSNPSTHAISAPDSNSYTDPKFFCNTPHSRRCWINGPAVWDYYTIETDYELRWPRGVVREYWLNVTYTTIAPDGVERIGQVVNGTYPGPLLEANWGDTLRIHVTNYLSQDHSPNPSKTAANGTTIHWHGIRQWRTTEADGVNGVTQCPISPGESYTYEWLAVQYGHTWYHSHYSLQYPDGLYGPLIIHGPTSANWDVDVGVVMISDWIHENAFNVFSHGELGALPRMSRSSSSTVINGQGIYPCLATDHNPGTNCTGNLGTRWSTTFKRGKKYLLRLVNTSADMQFRFSIDNHMLQVVQVDFVPIKPFMAEYITIGIGQRYTIIVHAVPTHNPPFPPLPVEHNFWIRTIPLSDCGSLTTGIWPTYGVIRYTTSDPTSDPKSRPYNNTYFTSGPECTDIDPSLIVPVVRWDIGNPWANETFAVGLEDSPGPHGFRRWEIAGTPMWLDWGSPAVTNLKNTTWNPEYDVIVENTPSGEVQWVYFIIQGNSSIKHPGITDFGAHPIHLHGHDFAILAQGLGDWDSLDPKPPLMLDNPARRDVVLLDAQGYLVIAFRTDNPGVWLMHCHIAWHASSGLALQVVERQSEIAATIKNKEQLDETCRKWKEFTSQVYVEQDDSGV